MFHICQEDHVSFKKQRINLSSHETFRFLPKEKRQVCIPVSKLLPFLPSRKQMVKYVFVISPCSKAEKPIGGKDVTQHLQLVLLLNKPHLEQTSRFKRGSEARDDAGTESQVRFHQTSLWEVTVPLPGHE